MLLGLLLGVLGTAGLLGCFGGVGVRGLVLGCFCTAPLHTIELRTVHLLNHGRACLGGRRASAALTIERERVMLCRCRWCWLRSRSALRLASGDGRLRNGEKDRQLASTLLGVR